MKPKRGEPPLGSAEMPEARSASFGFINSLLVLLASFGLTMLLLWAASRVAGVAAFEQLPEWLRSAYGALFTTLVSGGSLTVLAVKAVREKSGPNYLVSIIGVTILLLIIIVILAKAFPPHDLKSKPDVAPPIPQPPPYTKTLHTEDETGHAYLINWQMSPTCAGFKDDGMHKCVFTPTQRLFAGDHTPFDHWDMSAKAPGAVSAVLCQTTGSSEFNEVKGETRGEIEGDWGRCKGWINGGDFPVNVTVHYKMLW